MGSSSHIFIRFTENVRQELEETYCFTIVKFQKSVVLHLSPCSPSVCAVLFILLPKTRDR